MFKKLYGSRYTQYISALTATLLSAAVAMQFTYSWQPKLQGVDPPVNSPITDDDLTLFVSIFHLGYIPGCMVIAWDGQKSGVKKSLQASAVFTLIPWFIASSSIALKHLGRFIGGVGAGVITTCCVIYVAEIAERDIRGRLGSSFVLLKLVGTLVVLSTGPYIDYVWVVIICYSVPVIFVCSVYFMPESPYFLIKIDKKEKAKQMLILLSSKTAEDSFIEKRLTEIQNTVESDMMNKATLWEFLSKPIYRRPIYIMTGIIFLQHFSGLMAIDASIQTIVEGSKISISREIFNIILGALQIIAALFASSVVDKLGRKPLLIVSALGCAAALIVEGVYAYVENILEEDLSSVTWIPTAGVVIFVIMNSMGILTLPYVLLGELFPTNIKVIAVSAFVMFGELLRVTVSHSFQSLSDPWGIHVMFWIFGIICILGALFVFLCVPETKGKTFTDIQEMLQKSPLKNNSDNVL